MCDRLDCRVDCGVGLESEGSRVATSAPIIVINSITITVSVSSSSSRSSSSSSSSRSSSSSSIVL